MKKNIEEKEEKEIKNKKNKEVTEINEPPIHCLKSDASSGSGNTKHRKSPKAVQGGGPGGASSWPAGRPLGEPPEAGEMPPQRFVISFKRIIGFSFFFQVLGIILIFILSKSLFYSILFFLGAIISVAGFWTMIKLVDQWLQKGKGRIWFFLVGTAKMAVIAGGFYLASTESKTAVVLYILGILVIVGAVMAEALYHLCRSIFNGS